MTCPYGARRYVHLGDTVASPGLANVFATACDRSLAGRSQSNCVLPLAHARAGCGSLPAARGCRFQRPVLHPGFEPGPSTASDGFLRLTTASALSRSIVTLLAASSACLSHPFRSDLCLSAPCALWFPTRPRRGGGSVRSCARWRGPAVQFLYSVTDTGPKPRRIGWRRVLMTGRSACRDWARQRAVARYSAPNVCCAASWGGTVAESGTLDD